MVIYTLINSFFTLLNLVFFFYNIIGLITTLSLMIDNVPEVAVFLVRIVLLLTADGSPDFFFHSISLASRVAELIMLGLRSTSDLNLFQEFGP